MKNEKRAMPARWRFSSLRSSAVSRGGFAQRRIDHLRGLLRAAHRQVHAGGEHRIEKREGIADQHPARAAHAVSSRRNSCR